MNSERPVVPVVPEVNVARGNPTAEELAALVAVLRLRSAAAATPPAAAPGPRSAWSDPAARLRPPLPRHWR
jgi:hypothetical protein